MAASFPFGNPPFSLGGVFGMRVPSSGILPNLGIRALTHLLQCPSTSN